jgi:hypothetical protein
METSSGSDARGLGAAGTAPGGGRRGTIGPQPTQGPHGSFFLFLQEAVVSPRLRRFSIDGASRTPPAIGEELGAGSDQV